MSKMIADVLAQQASQFETIIGDLRTQITQLSMSPSKESHTKVKLMSTPSPRKTPPVSKSATSSKMRNSPKTPISNKPPKSTPPPNSHKMPKTPPIRKRHPLQMLVADVPADFKTVKEALFVHIKMMWGLYRANDVPVPPDASFLAEFNQRFSSSKQIE
ncbi:hypothetical protein DFH28DRAFT_862893, partial [Melampsora americana]